MYRQHTQFGRPSRAHLTRLEKAPDEWTAAKDEWSVPSDEWRVAVCIRKGVF